MCQLTKKEAAELVKYLYPGVEGEILNVLTDSYQQETASVAKGLGRRTSMPEKSIGCTPDILSKQAVHHETRKVQPPEAIFTLGETFISGKEPARYLLAKGN